MSNYHVSDIQRHLGKISFAVLLCTTGLQFGYAQSLSNPASSAAISSLKQAQKNYFVFQQSSTGIVQSFIASKNRNIVSNTAAADVVIINAAVGDAAYATNFINNLVKLRKSFIIDSDGSASGIEKVAAMSFEIAGISVAAPAVLVRMESNGDFLVTPLRGAQSEANLQSKQNTSEPLASAIDKLF